MIGNNGINGCTNTRHARKPLGSLEVEPIVAALFSEIAPSMAYAHMDGFVRTLRHTHKADNASRQTLGVEVQKFNDSLVTSKRSLFESIGEHGSKGRGGDMDRSCSASGMKTSEAASNSYDGGAVRKSGRTINWWNH